MRGLLQITSLRKGYVFRGQGHYWVWDGNEFHKKYDNDSSNYWVWDGDEFHKKYDNDSSNYWVLDRGEFHKKYDNDSSNYWEVGNIPRQVIAGFFVVILHSLDLDLSHHTSGDYSKRVSGNSSKKESAMAKAFAEEGKRLASLKSKNRLFGPLKKRYGNVLGRVYGLIIILIFLLVLLAFSGVGTPAVFMLGLAAAIYWDKGEDKTARVLLLLSIVFVVIGVLG